MNETDTPTQATEPRLRREPPAREHPVRNAATMFRPAVAKKPTDAAPRDGFVERGVANAYRVLDEHLRRGREAARARANDAHGTDAHGNDDRGGDPMSNEAQDITRKLARAWADMMYVWMDLVGPLADRAAGQVKDRVSGAGTRGPDPAWSASDREWTDVTPGSDTAPPATASAGARPSVEVEVTSQRPARVHVALDATSSRSFTVQKLQRTDGADVPPIGGLSLEPEGEGILLRVTVTSDQPVGVYTGLVIDRAASRPCGTVTLTLRE